MLDWRLTLYLKDEPVALFNLHQYKGVTWNNLKKRISSAQPAERARKSCGTI
jgi:hypothetical protein